MLCLWSKFVCTSEHDLSVKIKKNKDDSIMSTLLSWTPSACIMSVLFKPLNCGWWAWGQGYHCGCCSFPNNLAMYRLVKKFWHLTSSALFVLPFPWWVWCKAVYFLVTSFWCSHANLHSDNMKEPEVEFERFHHFLSGTCLAHITAVSKLFLLCKIKHRESVWNDSCEEKWLL